MATINWFNYGIEMAQKFCAGGDTYAAKGSQYVCEYEGISGTQSESEFVDGWKTIVSADGEVQMHQLLNRMKGGLK